ncbi:MAG TPA: hypothetical protein VJT72_21825 [Pseudonocardiaceae bacterium]|nr:hypothetical protein [Pseudonocardiaceae bacterium]
MANGAGHVSAQDREVPLQRRSRDPAEGLHLAGSVRTKPVRRSVDLSPTYHVRLTQWCAEAADLIGTPRVTGQDVIRALVARLLMDEALARRIRADLSIDL